MRIAISSVVGLPWLAWCIVSQAALAADINLNHDNAPAIVRRMGMTLEEFRSILSDREKPYAVYIPSDDPTNLFDRHNGQKDGQLFIRGQWARVGNRRDGPLDLHLRVGHSSYDRNPLFCLTTTALRTAPPEKFQPSPTEPGKPPARRIELVIRGALNTHMASPQTIRQYMAQWAKSAAESKPTDYYDKARHIPDLGFGLDRNDLYVYLPTAKNLSGGCQVIIQLADTKKAATIQVELFTRHQATSNQRAITLAKNAAALMANKVFGTNAKLERSPVEAGILDVYLASRLGRTPEEDVHENKFKLGDTIYLAVVYRPTEPGMRVRITGNMRPGPDALVASEARAPLVKPDLARSKGHSPKPLLPGVNCHGFDAWMTKDGQVDQTNTWGGDFLDATLSVKPMGSDAQVFYVAMTTGNPDNLEKFYLGIGRWDVAISMDEYRGKDAAFESRNDKDKQEVSTEKVQLFMADNPPVALRYLTELPKKKP